MRMWIFGGAVLARPASLRLVAAMVAALASAGAAHAGPARCYTTDDGEYDCEFTATDAAGSFEISAPGKPTFIILIEEPGVATGYGNFGDRNVPLPGAFTRSDNDPACWENAETQTEICAW